MLMDLCVDYMYLVRRRNELVYIIRTADKEELSNNHNK